jgi:hypothetical protein
MCALPALYLLLQVAELASKIDGLYSSVFVGVQLPAAAEAASGQAAHQQQQEQLATALPDPAALTEISFGELGRAAPKVKPV